MRYLDFLKRCDNLDRYIVLMDELGYKDSEIMEKLEISKTNLYDAKKRQDPLLQALLTISAELPADRRNKDIQLIVDTFVEVSGVTKTSKWDRFAAKRLADKHGAEEIAKLIKIYFSMEPNQYKPSVASIRQIEEKWVNIGNYMQKQIGNQEIDL